MACFLVPVAEAVVATVALKVVKSKEKEPQTLQLHTEHGVEAVTAIPFSKKLGWLTKLLWGGSILLLFEHIWHGEVVPFFPFLTAASDPASTAVMLQEMVTVGTSMALLLTVVWAVMLLVTAKMQKKVMKALPASE